jgi:hypothetical protein
MTTILTEIGWEDENGNSLGTWTNRADLVDEGDEITVAENVTANSLAGNDIIIGTSTEETVLPVPPGFGIPVIGIYNRGGSIDVDHGNDFISGTGNGIENSVGILNIEGSIEGNNGEDSIFGIGTGNGGFGIYNGDSNIDGGNGNDSISGTATSNSSDSVTVGILNQGTINTGNGNDTVDALTGGFAAIDALGEIDLGSGRDLIKGCGEQIVDGGRGFDTSELGIDFDENLITFGSTAPTSIDITFDSATMSFTDVELFNFNGQEFSLEQLQDMV